jgi:hypothetical protein
VEIARRICADCPVKEPCLEYALYNRIEHGVWGGASERERRRIARRRRTSRAPSGLGSPSGATTPAKVARIEPLVPAGSAESGEQGTKG